MFGLQNIFKKKNPHEAAAGAVYAALLARMRRPVFYESWGVPDTLTGRYEILVLQAAPVISRMKDEGTAGRDFNQALFDVFFRDMDQSLREIGIGDMGVPKRMRKMMRAFNGRVQAYDAAASGADALRAAIARNIYAANDTPSDSALTAIAADSLACFATLRAQTANDILNGKIVLP